MQKTGKFIGILMVLLMVLSIGGVAFTCLDNNYIAFGEDDRQTVESTEADGKDAETRTAEDSSQEEETAGERWITVTPEEAVLYEKDDEGKNHISDTLRDFRLFWNSLAGRTPVLSENSGRERKAPVKVKITGELPEDVTAKATYIETDEDKSNTERALYALQIELYDGSGETYIPESPVRITVAGRSIVSAFKDNNAFLVYSYLENPEREAANAKKNGETLYAADVMVYKDSYADDDHLTYSVYDEDESYKKGEDAVRYAEDEGGLTVYDNKTIEFEYDYDKAAETSGEDLTANTAHFVVSAQASKEELEKADKAAEEAEKAGKEGNTGSDGRKTIVDETRKYRVTVTYGEEAGLPEDAQLKVKELKGFKYRQYRRSAAREIRAEKLDYARAFDITITDSEGNEFEPAADVDVKIELINDKKVPDELKVVHFEGSYKEDGSVIRSETRRDTVSFETDGFSVYVLVFTSNESGYSYSITADDTILLSDLLIRLSITDFGIEDVEEVSSTDDECVHVERIEPAGEDPVDWLISNQKSFDESEVLTLTLTNGDTVDISVEYSEAPTVVITAGSATREYNGHPLTNSEYTVDGLADGDSLDSVTVTGSQEDAGESANVPSDAIIKNGEGEDVNGKYNIVYVNGTLTVEPKGVTLTANSRTEPFNFETDVTRTVSGFTCDVNGLTFDGVSASGSGSDVGIYDVVFSGVTLNETKDTTGNYIVKKTVNGIFMIQEDDDEHPMISKELVSFNGDIATYRIDINPTAAPMSQDPDAVFTLKDTFSANQSINYGTIKTTCEPATGDVTYDYSGNTGTFTIPDVSHVTITYDTRVKGKIGNDATFSNEAQFGKYNNGQFVYGASASAGDTRTLTPTGTDISGSGGDYRIKLFVYPDGHMENGLEGAVFRLLDQNKRPMSYSSGDHAGETITFTTDDDGYADIKSTEGLTIHKNTAYYLEMITAPYTIVDGNYVYYQKDDTYYRFIITDEADYSMGGNYTYFNDDVLKVRCYTEGQGVNVTKRFSGNYDLTDEQKNAIKFTLQKEDLTVATNWVDVESHTYADFSWGVLNFNTGSPEGEELEDNATYRVIEENALPAELEGIVEEDVSVNISYQVKGRPVEADSNEFFIDPDDKQASSYDLTFTNSYVMHKLTIIKLDETKGEYLKDAVFKVYRADNSSEAVATYTTGDDGKVEISKGDFGSVYQTGTLYYAVEETAPGGYILPEQPEKIYFYFSANGSGVPGGLPSGKTATDLTTSYNTVTVPNDSDEVDVPVTVVWGLSGKDAWPDEVDHIVVGLYKSVGGADPVEVMDSRGQPVRLNLTKTTQYDTTSFTDLDAVEDGKQVRYSVEQKFVFDGSGHDISSHFASSSNVSGTGWYVIKNQDAISVDVEKKWYELGGEAEITATSGKDDVSFDLYRTTKTSSETEFTRAELMSFLSDAEKVRTGLKLSYSGNWETTVESLQKTDSEGHTYYYYAIEDVPDNQEDDYIVADALGSANRRLTIKNTQTPITVNIKAKDLSKIYGTEDPDLDFDASVKQPGAEVEISGPDEDNNYIAKVKDPDGVTHDIEFSASRVAGENAGTYAINLTGETLQHGYRVVLEGATFTINRADVKITAGATKVYGQTDPELVSIEGLANGDNESVLVYEVSREEGEDVGDYAITLEGDTVQGNYNVSYVKTDTEGNPYRFTITRKAVTVTADDKSKTYGADDPDFSVTVDGLIAGDEATVIVYDVTREAGEDVKEGGYTITPSGSREQGNYSVTYETGTFTINKANLTVTMGGASKTYGDADPGDWNIRIEGLQGDDGDGELSYPEGSSLSRLYSYTARNGGTPVVLFTFTATREAGEDVKDGGYDVVLAKDTDPINYNVEYRSGKLTIERAVLSVKPKDMVKAVNVEIDPVLTADISGWKNGDDTSVGTYTWDGPNGAPVIWTYKRQNSEEVLLSFTLQRVSGEDEGEYAITATGEEYQSNYNVEYYEGTFSINSIVDVDVDQPLTDYADYSADPAYTYRAVLDLAGTGIDVYAENGFVYEEGEDFPSCTFTLGGESGESMKTLKVPGGSLLTVTQETTNSDYTTAIKQDGVGYDKSYYSERINTYREVSFTHSRISLQVEARAAVGQTEAGAVTLDGRKGAVGIPPEETDHTRAVDRGFADEMHSKIGFNLPTDMYYDYDHASLYTTAGVAVEGATNITSIKYIEDEGGKWQYKTNSGYVDIREAADTKIVLFYLPKFVCKIGTEKFYSLKAAVEYAESAESGLSGTATIEMLIDDYSIRSAFDVVTIDDGSNITIKTASTGYEGESGSKAVISRSNNYTNGYLIVNNGNLKFENIILDGKDIQAGASLLKNEADGAEIVIEQDAEIRNSRATNGGAVYVSSGDVTVKGTLENNSADSGGAIYLVTGNLTFEDSSVIKDNHAVSGGAIYAERGTVTFSNTKGNVSGNHADRGGVLFLANGNAAIDGTVGSENSESKNTAQLGGAVYVAGGSLEVKAADNILDTDGSIIGSEASGNGGAIYQAGGTVDIAGTIKDNNAAYGGGVYRADGTLNVSGTLSNNTASAGGAIHSTGGTLKIDNATIKENSAVNGAAIYVSNVDLYIDGGKLSGNSSGGNGGAIYALNSTTIIGGSKNGSDLVEGSAVTIENNEALSGKGGAVYMEGGSLTLIADSNLTGNKANKGGAAYAASGTLKITDGRLTGNEANNSGGAIYTESASVELETDAVISGNKAKQGNGGGVCADSGKVSISGGTLTGNSASKGESSANGIGLGGAVYTDTGTVNYSAGSISANNAVNGAAIFVRSGNADISASITGNTASEGGAVGVGTTNARLYFRGSAEVNENKMNGKESNVYLDVDSELVINADSLNSGKNIGIYVPGEVTTQQFIKHGDVTGYFGAYASAGTLANLSSVFKSDRYSDDLSVKYENNRLYWACALKYDVYWLRNYDSQFPPTSSYTSAPSKKVCTGKSYNPRSRESDIYDLVMAMKLYETHNNDFKNNVGANYASLAVYAYTYSDKAMGNTFGNYLKTVRWDPVARKWKFIKQDGTEAPANTSKLVIFYSAPAYLTIVNNNSEGLDLDLSEISVLGKNAADGLYGFVTAKNGATVQTLRALTQDDLKLEAGESIKLMFPGAQGQSFVLNGSFDGATTQTSISYTFNGDSYTTGADVNLNDSSIYKFNSSDEAAELIFGSALPICKVGDVEFTTLKDAMTHVIAQKAATGSSKYTIEMLVDYLVPADDVLDIPEGYDITFTTSQDDDFRGSRQADSTRPYNQAILSRDTGNSGSSVKATKSPLSVDKLAFDGRSLTAGGAGGAVSTNNCTEVTITNCEFSGYRADQGGAVYVENRNAGSKLTVEDCYFYNCQTNANVDKAGGGGIWTTARELYVRRCDFDSCACLQGKAQAGSVFHNIQKNWSAGSVTEIDGCTFSNSYAVGGSGGTIETDALRATISDCEFHGSYTNKDKANGGAINALAGDMGTSSTTGWVGTINEECWLTVRNCLFDECRASNNGNGGAIVSSMWYVTIEDCKFVNNYSKYGGAVKMTNANAKWLHIKGSTFMNCDATGEGGAVYAAVPEIKIEKSTGGTYMDDTDNNGSTYFIDCKANRGGGIDNEKNDAEVTMENVNFTRCVARTSYGGALNTKAKTLKIEGDSNSFTDCTAQNSGGAVYQNRNTDGSSVTLENCLFDGCESNAGDGKGGGMHTNARTLTIRGEEGETATAAFKNCTASNVGGGLFHDYGGEVTITNCGFENCTAKAASGGGMHTTAKNLTVTGPNSKFKNCTAQTDGGGLYQTRNATGSTFTFEDASFERCTAMGNCGGAIYTDVKTVSFKGGTVSNSTAKAQGGGIYINPSLEASFDENCTITGNYVTNSDGKGGDVYVAGGKTEFRSGNVNAGNVNAGNVSGYNAADGGGWYQNNGTLYILGGSISGKASNNGGGLYVNDGNTKVYHYGGTVEGTAAANGGGVYKNNGTYTIGDDTYNGTSYAGASIGTLSVNESGSCRYSAEAVNGGGIYNNAGTLTVKSGSSISGRASSEGGGIWNKTTVSQSGGDVTGDAANGGGVYQTDTSTGKYTFGGGTIVGTASADGGAVYHNGNSFSIGSGAVLGERTISGEDANTTLSSKANNNGGGLYAAGVTASLSNGGLVAGAKATKNGGGVYVADGTFSFTGGSIVRNSAGDNGGGVYYAGGSFSMTNGAVIGGTADNGNTAKMGAGVYVADGQSALFKDIEAKTLNISYNHATTEGGGIAVGGPNAELIFEGTVTVRYNTMVSQDTQCNVYLNQDSNSIIRNNALNAASYIGVYASDAQEGAHGKPGMPFATYSTGNSSNLNIYRNDRIAFLYGVNKGSDNLVVWSKFVCKITDGDGNLLYKDAEGTPAVYEVLENGQNVNNGAFNTLGSTATPSLYLKDEEGNFTQYTDPDGKGYQVQMLVQEYEMGNNRRIKLSENANRKIVLTTASPDADDGFAYTGDARFNATIKRTAETNAMIFVGGNAGWELTLRDINLDGNGCQAIQEGAIVRVEANGRVVLDSGAVLKNGQSGYSGGAVYISNSSSSNIGLVMNAGSEITACSTGTGNGGAVYINMGTFDMTGGRISGCSASAGGGVYVKTGQLNMSGGEITNNDASSKGGGIALFDSGVLTFSRHCIVTGNTLNDETRCNVELGVDSNERIYANDIDGRSEIGVYTAGTIYTAHGESGDPFGTWSVDGDNLFVFINDCSTNLRGFQSANETDTRIFWEYHPLLTVSKAVSSDWSYDHNTAEFRFKVKLVGKQLSPSERSKIEGDMNFDENGEAIVTLKDSGSATAILPDNYDNVPYEITEILNGAQEEDYTTTASKDGKAYPFADDKPMTVCGILGENIGTENSTSRSTAAFTNTRVRGDLMLAKQVVSKQENDKSVAFNYTVTLADENINETYETVTKFNDTEAEVNDHITFENGTATIILRHGQTTRIEGLPTDIGYTVTEVLTDDQSSRVRVQVQKNGGETVFSNTVTGNIGDNTVIETDGMINSVYLSEVLFTNNFLDIVCKITSKDRALLYYRDSTGALQPAIYTHLEDAFSQVNMANLRTAQNGSYSGIYRVEMVVREYSMEETAVLNNGRTVLLSTALTSDPEYPYNNGEDDKAGNTAVVFRGFTDGSMITDSGSLTVDKIILDGASAAEEALTGTGDGGIISVEAPVTLTVNSSAVLRNSAVTGNGGAVSLVSGSTIKLNGTIENCSAAGNGGGIYANKDFAKIETNGSITGCHADGSGGAVYASEGTTRSSVNINADTYLTGNTAGENGGAIYSDTSMVLKGHVGGTELDQGNTAVNSGGGIYMGSSASFTMYTGSSISGNHAKDGGGLLSQAVTTIAGGSLENNTASEKGGAVYAADTAAVTVSGSASLSGNAADMGGAVYDGGSLTMKGGSMTNNTATGKGGAVFVLGSKRFTMSGGTISGGNKSPEGAVSTGENAVLAFSGSASVRDNTDSDGSTPKNVYLGYDSNTIITSSGLGSTAYIGIYVADGEPEPEGTPDRVDNPIYCDHGVSARNFGTYTGSNISSARLNLFVNDRDASLHGVNGGKTAGDESRYFIAWNGKGLEFSVLKYAYEGTDKLISGATFILENSSEEERKVQVWSGRSENGLVEIPWIGDEREGGDAARFAPKSTYTLTETASAGDGVRPAGKWTLTIGRDNSVTWQAVQSETGETNRTLEVALPELPEGATKAYLGDRFRLYNDIKPTITYDATGGKLADGKYDRTDKIAFETTDVNYNYNVNETNPSWDSHVFRGWATMETGTAGDEGYFEYKRGDTIKFFRGDGQPTAYEQGKAKGDITLYAQWDEVVCKITDREGTLVYVNGSPAVYSTLEAGFNSFNTDTFTYKNGGRATIRRIEMLVEQYTLNEAVTLERTKTVMLTTAPSNDTDGYSYTGSAGSVCTIIRGENLDGSMITNRANLSVMNVTLDGGSREIDCDGGIIKNVYNSAVLTIASGATLRNSHVKGNGGAVYVKSGTSLHVTGGNITGNRTNEGSGAGIYLEQGSTMEISGNPYFGGSGGSSATLNSSGNFALVEGYDENSRNGGQKYPQDNDGNYLVRQDIFIDGYAGNEGATNAASLVVAGDITSGNGTIWVWAEEAPHYKLLSQFARINKNAKISDLDSTLKAFRNARNDESTENNTKGYLYGTTGDKALCVYWSGSKGSRMVVLRKVGADSSDNIKDASLSGGEFSIYTDKECTKLASDITGTIDLTGLKSGYGGVFFSGELSFGTYYVKETKAPADYNKPASGYCFVVTVDENGVGYSSGSDGLSNKVKATKVS